MICDWCFFYVMLYEKLGRFSFICVTHIKSNFYPSGGGEINQTFFLPLGSDLPMEMLRVASYDWAWGVRCWANPDYRTVKVTQNFMYSRLSPQ